MTICLKDAFIFRYACKFACTRVTLINNFTITLYYYNTIFYEWSSKLVV